MIIGQLRLRLEYVFIDIRTFEMTRHRFCTQFLTFPYLLLHVLLRYADDRLQIVEQEVWNDPANPSEVLSKMRRVGDLALEMTLEDSLKIDAIFLVFTAFLNFVKKFDRIFQSPFREF